MVNILTTTQMRALEQEAIASGRVTGVELMERAGAGVVEAVFEEWPELAEGAHRAVVLCGPGNNGGDGFVVARLLAEAGWDLVVFLYGQPEKLPPDAKVNYERWEELGAVHSLSGDFFECYKNYGELVDETERHIYIDALFGIGLTRPLPHILTDIVYSWDFDSKVVNGSKFVAIDVPSGMDADAGEEIDPDNSEGPLPVVNLTVTFHSLKPGHIKKYGPHHCGKTVVKDIGL